MPLLQTAATGIAFQRPRKRSLGVGFEGAFTRADEKGAGNDGQHPRDAEADRQWTAEALDLGSQEVCCASPQRCPGNAARGVEEEEPPPRHPVCAGEKGGPRPQDRYESSEEHDLGPEARKQITSNLDSALIEADIPAIADEQAVAAPVPEQVSEVVAQDGARDRRQD